ncbi:type VI secretion system protein ImpG [Arboricoccus pini]|uniref:Type VI secretion system protein ImpG n=1 Tax=Arboricoccus pini TaxID=1963835 RepID=A0A212RQU8_9PROT|nr:type VI secretion system baseplate subunit TssF [Arboricoccus pini]SNB74789.1 type VI secretion system protein ImpG [Arboricoccus pini]
MDPRLLQLYNDELAYMREMGSEFAQAFPKIAGRLGMEGDEVADPYVERLLEGVAFLAARVQLKQQARFPAFTQHLLELVYPHFLAPMPSMTIVRLEPDPEAGRLEQGYIVPRMTRLVSQPPPGAVTHCTFHTAHDVQLWPLQVESVDYQTLSSAIAAMRLPSRPGVKAILRIRLRTTNGMQLRRLALRKLDLHLTSHGSLGALVTEQLLAGTIAMVARPTTRPAPWQEVIERRHLRQTGLEPEQALLPDIPRTFDGYRLLQEYFSLPERTCFIEVTGLADAIARSADERIDLIFLLDRIDQRLERHLATDNIALFATPAINLFEWQADRVEVSDRSYEYHLVPDRTRPLDLEVHSVLDIKGEFEGDTKPLHFKPFYSMADHEPADSEGAAYTIRRDQRLISAHQRRQGPRSAYVGSEVFLQLSDRNAAPFAQDLRQLTVKCRCSNRDLPLLLPVGKGNTDFTLEIGAPVSNIRCLNGPTPPRASRATGDVAWHLISHLSLNYLSITGAKNAEVQGADALRQLLRLYAEDGATPLLRQIEGLRQVISRPIVRRLPGGGQTAVARGLEVELTVDETAFAGTGAFPLGAVLSHFFAKYVSINSFTETVLVSAQRGEIMRWPMMTGRRATL